MLSEKRHIIAATTTAATSTVKIDNADEEDTTTNQSKKVNVQKILALSQKSTSSLLNSLKRGSKLKGLQHGDTPPSLEATKLELVSTKCSAGQQHHTRNEYTITERYYNTIAALSANHKKKCEKLQIPMMCDPSKHHMRRYLHKQHYLRYSSREFIDKLGKRKRITYERDNQYRCRLTFFNGGSAYFPHHIWKTIFGLRAQEIETKSPLFDNDIAYSVEGIKLFIEIDEKNRDTVPSQNTIVNWAMVTQNTVRRFFPKANLRMWVLCSPSKPKSCPALIQEPSMKLIATGVHIVFPHVIVDCEKGRQITHSVNLDIEKETHYVNLVDTQPWKSQQASLRPIFSHKKEKCYTCENIDELRRMCPTCFREGFLSSGSVYKPFMLVDTHGKMQHKEMQRLIRNQLPVVIEETSIVHTKLNAFTPGYTIGPDEVQPIPFALRSTYKADIGKEVFKQDRKIMGRMNQKGEEIHDPNILNLVLAEIRSFNEKYSEIMITSISRKKQICFVNLKGRGYRTCFITNKEGKNHQSNRIYFKIDFKRKKVFQCCYDNECIKQVRENMIELPSQDLSTLCYNTLFSKNVKNTMDKQISKKVY